jgi:hypothetical protein
MFGAGGGQGTKRSAKFVVDQFEKVNYNYEKYESERVTVEEVRDGGGGGGRG